MDLSYSPAELAFRDELRAWLEANHPGPAPVGEEHGFEFAREWQRRLAQAGWAGFHWPAEYGGRGATVTESAIFYTELARARAPLPANTLGEDIEAARDAVRPYIALYTGGMGSPERNFYNELMCRAGFAAQARVVQDHYLAGRKREAEAALPVEFIDEVALYGPSERIAVGVERYRDAGAGTLLAVPVGPDRLEDIRGLAAAAQLTTKARSR